jgi:nucleoside-diphosphate-sugar epimerase/NADPH:quinone reductase-like Zn-dependent oxidoreductase/GTP cyclohydrolase II/arylamine N-acetyltransferase/ectoine hydroxylase-related dioxygenase (phytanoyl-CoA dioxygenase family)/acyl carrier protein
MACLDHKNDSFGVAIDGNGGVILSSSNDIVIETSGIQLQQCSTSLLSTPGSTFKVELLPIPTNESELDQKVNTSFKQAEKCMNDVHFLLKDDDLSNKFDALKLFVEEACKSESQLCIILSRAKGFAGFIRSLQKEPGYSHLRGVHLLHHEEKDLIDDASLECARNIFISNNDCCCLVIDGPGGKVMEEQQIQPDPFVFPSKHGSYLALSLEQSEKCYCWKPIVKLLDCEEKPVEILYSSLNYRDALIGSGRLRRDEAIFGYGQSGGGFGLDFAGYLLSSERRKVIGLGRDCIGAKILNQPNYLLWELSDDADLEAFATVPCAYATAYYGLCVRGNLKKNDCVLVHCGAGGVGLAAIFICKHRLADPSSQLFVTCSSKEKSQYLHKDLNIPIENIGDSRSSSFKDLVMSRTNGRGVDMVLNSLSGELMRISVRCLSYGGYFLELGKCDIDANVIKELRHKDRQLAMIDLDQLMASEDKFTKVREYLTEGLKSHEVVPLKYKVFVAPNEIDEAFEHMMSGSRIGKAVLKIDQSATYPTEPCMLATLPDQSLSTKQVIIIVGGLGDLGLCVAQWLAMQLRAACRLLLCTRSSNSLTNEQKQVLHYMRDICGSIVDIHVGDLSDKNELDNLLLSLCDGDMQTNIFGFFNLAASSKDTLFDNMDEDSWNSSFPSKAQIATNFASALLDRRFQQITSQFQHFVCVSSIVVERGNAGQTNYGCANAAMEEVMMDRVNCGFSALCIRLGFVHHTGLATSLPPNTPIEHLAPIDVGNALRHLERLVVGRKNGLYTICGTGTVPSTKSDDRIIRPMPNNCVSEVDYVLEFIRKHVQGGVLEENSSIDNHSFDSLGMIILKNQLESKLGLSFSLEELSQHTPMTIAVKYSKTLHPKIVVVATVGKFSIEVDPTKQKTLLSDALCSIQNQTNQPDYVVIVFESNSDSEMILTRAEVEAILPSAKIVFNERSINSKAGALNTGVMRAFSDFSFDERFWVVFIDPMKHCWKQNHLECCTNAIYDNSYGWVLTCENNEDDHVTFPVATDPSFYMQHAPRSCWAVTCSLFFEAGMFDEALSSTMDYDLSIRIRDVMSSQNIKHHQLKQCTVIEQHISLVCEDVECDAKLFLYKYYARMNRDQLAYVMKKLQLEFDHNIVNDPGKLCLVKFSHDLVHLPTWNNDGVNGKVTIRRDTNELLTSGKVDQLHNINSNRKMLIGIITGDHRRVTNVLSDLGSKLSDVQHSVVVFANSTSPKLADIVLKLLQPFQFRSHVIQSTAPIIQSLFPSDVLPLPIAKARTVLQTFLLAVTKVEDFDAVAVLDDDMRLPEDWGIRDEDEKASNILLGRAIKTPPNVTVMSMRTQLLDFVYALDTMHSTDNTIAETHHHGSSTNCPSLKVFKNLNDQYYDLASNRWDHLEIPRNFSLNCEHKKIIENKFVEQCKRRILVGDPLAREAVSIEEGETFQRGGCMVLLKNNFHLLQKEQLSPMIKLASGKTVASRRSDTFWVQYHCMDKPARAVVRRHLSFLHDNTYDSIPSDVRMREAVALEMIGAILCRPSETRDDFAHKRIGALKASIARIRGICKTLRGKDYLSSIPALKDFVETFESIFSTDAWQVEVFDVINKHVSKLKLWSPLDETGTREILPYSLNDTEKSFLVSPKSVSSFSSSSVTTLQSNVYPHASDIRSGPTLPIPCLHRIHDKVLEGAQKVQEKIGMSLSLSEVTVRLRKLSELVSTMRKSFHHSANYKALVTIDDGFRDVLMLQAIFKELSDSIQPVLCIPSSIMRESEGMTRRHLPLTCLYDYCSKHNIDPEDEGVLGRAKRTFLKTLPEKEQYSCLLEAGIPIDIPTDDLLSVSDLNALSNEGWWICSHGPDHSDLTTSPGFDNVLDGLKKDFNWLQQRGWTPWLAWPEGRWCARIADAVGDKSIGATAQFGLLAPPKGEPQHPAVLSRVAWFGGDRRPRVMVTGSEGFLGKHLVLVLQGYGYDVFSYDITDGFDILNKEVIIAQLRDKRIDTCIHLAAIADLNVAEADPTDAHRVNIEGTRIVLSCCDEVGVRLLFASTCCAYGNNNVTGSSSELSPVVPTEIYAETKVEGEKLVLGSSRVTDLHHVAMRLATFYGPDMRPALATSLFLKAAENHEPIEIHGSGEQTRCFTHVHDIAEGIRVVLQTSNFSGIINIADDREVSVNELAQMAMRITGNKVDIIKVADRKGQIRKSRINNDRLRGLGNLGWTPTVSLEDGLRCCSAPKLLPSCDTCHSSSTDVESDDNDSSVKLISSCKLEHTKLPIEYNDGDGTMFVSEMLSDNTQLIAYVVGNVFCSSEVIVRIHSECFNGDVLGSRKCDCGPQIKQFLKKVGDHQPGVLIYVKGHEGRGAGLLTKTRAYYDVDQNPAKHHNQALLDAGAEQIDARRYDAAAVMLLRVIAESRPKNSCSDCNTTIVLHTNNNDKFNALNRMVTKHNFGATFHCRQQHIPAGDSCCHHNQKYLKEKEADNNQSGLFINVSSAQSTSTHQTIPANIDQLKGVETLVNDKVFDFDDPGKDDFMKKNGFVVVRGLLSKEQVKRANETHEDISRDLHRKICERVGDTEILFEEISAEISQHRDLFLRSDGDDGNVFKELVLNNAPNSLAEMARQSMAAVDPEGNWNGIKLLHDHTITKPPGLLVSKKIPLHQDRMFWPVDIPACSSWTPLTDVHLDSGCLEVMSLATKPHLHRQSAFPVDFMADEETSGTELMLQDDPNPVRWLLPMQAGDTLIFSSSVWHRSSPNSRRLSRLVYIQTWVHPCALWRPDLVPWHPVNEHLRKAGYKPRDVLGGERHPTIIGCNVEETQGCDFNSVYARDSSLLINPTKKTNSDISMFDASDVVSTQIRNIILTLKLEDSEEDINIASMVDIIKNPRLLHQIVTITQTLSNTSFGMHNNDETISGLYQESGCKTIEELLSRTLRRIMISTAAYECDRSRNVFNSAYKAWWDVAGAAWNNYFLHGKFKENYKLCKTDVNRFLEYIHVKREDFQHCDKLGLLRAIIEGCFEYIPFQNITMLTRLKHGAKVNSPPTLGQIIEDMVTGVGGLCFSRNPFLFLLLKALNFDNVRFAAGTMCFEPLESELVNAHVLVIVEFDEQDYWVDIANGWPYLDIIPLKDTDSVTINHPRMETRLVKKKKHNQDVFVVEHLVKGTSARSSTWKENYYFRPIDVTYDIFDEAIQTHYSDGHFLKCVRFNLWSQTKGVILRNEDLVLISKEPDEENFTSINVDLMDMSAISNIATNIKKFGFDSENKLTDLRHAWCFCQKNDGKLEEAEKITVTGGFFDNTANGYVGIVTVWRAPEPPHNVMGLTFKMVREYVPDQFPVINKGFAGGSWYNNDLYVCWPNRVAVVSPLSSWDIKTHIDNHSFNDLHHAHACDKRIWVANTGCDSIDNLSIKSEQFGKLISRKVIADGVQVNDSDDVRSQAKHDLRRGRDKEHVNYVSIDNTPRNGFNVMATLLQSKKVKVVNMANNDSPDAEITNLPSISPPHEGFLELVPILSDKPLLWNSTVDGLIFASDPETSQVVKTWDLSTCNLPRGWTRGLCILKDGFLVGSTAIRGDDAAKWIEKHGNHWNFETSQSCTSVSFIPFDSSTSATSSVEFLSDRRGKVFSLLHTPSTVSHNL